MGNALYWNANLQCAFKKRPRLCQFTICQKVETKRFQIASDGWIPVSVSGNIEGQCGPNVSFGSPIISDRGLCFAQPNQDR